MPPKFALIFGIFSAAVLLSCGPPLPGPGNYGGIEQCRFDPGCAGGMGALCEVDAECKSGFCCDDGTNCAGGMCTAPCDVDLDCPTNMLCEHHVCFFACDSDADCADGMSCEHKNRVCEWK